MAPLLLLPGLVDPMLGIAAGVAAIAGLLAYRSVAYPVALSGLAVVVVALHGGRVGDEGTVPILLLFWVAVAVGFELIRKDGGLPAGILLSAPVLASVALWAVMFARLAGSPAAAYGSFKFQLFAENVVLVVAGILIARRKSHFDRYLFLTMLVASLSALVLTQQLVAGQVETVGPGRETLTGLNPILLGRVSGIGIIVAVHLALVAAAFRVRLVALCTLPILAVALLASGSRGPVIGVVLGVTVLLALALRERASRVRLAPLVAGIGLAYVLVSQLVPGQSLDRALSVLLPGVNSLSSTGRTELWAIAYEHIREEPLLGLGTGGFAAVAPALYPHNLFLEVTVELGVVGLVLLIVILASGARRLITAWSRDDAPVRLDVAVVAAILVAELTNAFLSGEITTNAPIWLAVGLGLGLGLREPQVGATVDLGGVARGSPRA